MADGRREDWKGSGRMTVKVFLCHHENDARYSDELSKHLRSPERSQAVELWSRRCVQPGEDVRKVVDEKLEQADLILVLMSVDLLGCDYCWGVEVSAALQRHNAGRARLIPIIVRPCDWRGCFPELKPVPASGAPLVTATSGIDDARFLEAFNEIMTIVRSLARELEPGTTSVTSVDDILTELHRLEEQSQSSAGTAAAGLFRLSAGLRYLDPARGMPGFADETEMRAAIPPQALAPMRRVCSRAYDVPDKPSRRGGSQLTGHDLPPRYRLQSKIASGGMGTVWTAEDVHLGRPVAVKLLLRQHQPNEEIRERFKQEAHILARLNNPHIVRVFDYGETSAGVPYIAMELLEGETLGARLQRLRTLPVAFVTQIIGQVASALATAHASGVVHRDIKPENIFLSSIGGDTFVKLIDFGIAKAPPSDQLSLSTMTGQILGTPTHMSPDSMFGSKDVDGRADVWGLGALAYEALTGQRPFQGKSFPEVVIATDKGVFVKPTTLQPGLPDAIDAWTSRALSRDRDTRFASVTEAAVAFKEAAGRPSRRPPPLASPVQAIVVPALASPPAPAPPAPAPPPSAHEDTMSTNLPHSPQTLVSGGRETPGALELSHRAGRREGRSEGRLEQAARAVLTVLHARGLVVLDVERVRILAERDPDRLERWLHRAATLSSVDEVLNESAGGP
ncbi:MAG: protein kinase [Polyangiaceae bacterium]